MISYLIVLFISINATAYATQPEPEPNVDILKYGTYEHCEGKDAANYTILEKLNLDQFCSKSQDNLDIEDNLVACSGSKQRSVNVLKRLSIASFPAGAYTQSEKLWLSTSGSLEGKYVYEKTIHLDSAYLKKCSSILGYSYVTSKSSTLLIADKLDLNTLISPTGAFDAFKKQCATVCQGVAYCF